MDYLDNWALVRIIPKKPIRPIKIDGFQTVKVGYCDKCGSFEFFSTWVDLTQVTSEKRTAES